MKLTRKMKQIREKSRYSSACGCSFYDWFHYSKSNIVKRSMLMGIRKKCDITNGKEFTTNGTKNANSLIKALSSYPTKWSDTPKKFVGISRQII